MRIASGRLLDHGLSHQAAKDRLKQFGSNELPSAQKVGHFHRLIKLLKEPMLLLLVVISTIYLLTGELTEGIALGFSAVLVIAIAYYQDFKSERALESLRDYSSPRALVIRQGEEKRIPATELVPGDLVVLNEGDRVPADGFLLHAAHLSIDESLLTGEAFPVKKESTNVDEKTDLRKIEDEGRVYMGTLVTGGKGLVRIVSTGTKTEMGKIGTSLAELNVSETFLSKEVKRLVRFFGWTGGILCLGITVFYGTTRADWMGGILAGLASAMSLLPEEFPVVLTVFLAIGAWRLSRVQILVRRPSATERLGAITALCVDKTGTITLNKMTVSALATERKVSEGLPKEEDEFRDLIQWSVMASHPHPFDPMEKAIHAFQTNKESKNLELIKEYPLTKELFATSFAWRNLGKDQFLVGTKGAPEAVLALCGISGDRAKNILGQAQLLAQKGLRILGVGKAYPFELPSSQKEIPFEWVGLIGFEDPVRAEVPHAMDLCAIAGIRVYMITGDYPETARNVAKKAGMEITENVLTGSEIEAIDDIELKNRIQNVRIFARMRPEQKLRIVNALKAAGDVVAMTGDGVNDAPSLKQSDIGIAMGARGTDVAREAADIVLVDDNFASIISGIERGRSIFTNLKNSMSYIISIHIPLAGLAFFPVVFGWPLLLLPIHIALLELIIDPTCSLLFESQEPEEGIMQRPPRRVDEPLFSPRDFLRCSLEGFLILIPSLLLYRHEIQVHGNADVARAVSLLFLGCSNVGLIVADLTGGRFSQLARLRKSRLNLGLLAGIAALLFVLVEVPQVASLFHFAVLSGDDLLKAIGLGIIFFFVASLWNRSSGRNDSLKERIQKRKAQR